MIERRLIEDIFANCTRNGWDMRLDMVWGYWFLAESQERLDQPGQWLVDHGYRCVGLTQQGANRIWLHLERFEVHTVDSLCARNTELDNLAQRYGVVYDGPDVGQPVASREWLSSVPNEEINLTAGGSEEDPIFWLNSHGAGAALVPCRPLSGEITVTCTDAQHQRREKIAGPVVLEVGEEDIPTSDFLWSPCSQPEVAPRAQRVFDDPWACLVSRRAQQVFASAGLIGYRLESVLGIDGKSEIKGLRRLLVTGWAGMARPESGVQFSERLSCRRCGMPGYSGPIFPEKMFDLENMDYSDFLLLWPLPQLIFITRRAAIAIQDAGLTGCNILPVQSIMSSLAEQVFPGSPSQWFMASELSRVLKELRFGSELWPSRL